jgi:hypothetical protein
LIVFTLCLVCSMLPVSLDYPFLIAPSVLSNGSLLTKISPLRRFYGRYHDLVNRCGISATNDY